MNLEQLLEAQINQTMTKKQIRDFALDIAETEEEYNEFFKQFSKICEAQGKDQHTGNVKMIRDEKFRLIRGSIPREVRNELNTAVKAGHLGHIKKDGLAREVFYHPSYKIEAFEARRQQAIAAIEAIKKVVC